MKTTITFLTAVLVIASFTSYATVRTVSNHPLGGAQYTNLGDAYYAAATNDTLLIEGTSTSYTMPGGNFGFRWEKSLVVIGSGLNTQKQNFQTTKFAYAGAGCNDCFIILANGSGSKFYGIEFNAANEIRLEGVSNLVFENCKFNITANSIGTCNNIVFRNCIFGSWVNVSSSGSMNWLITNSVINGVVGASGSAQTITVDHCLFLSSGGCFSNCVGIEVKNNIFMNSTEVSGITSSNFQNNLLRLSSTFPPAGNTDSGENVVGADPLLVNYTFDSPYSSSHDYDVQPGSPAELAGSDGTDIGVHGGYTSFSETGEVLIVPVVRSMNIPNSSAPVGGTLNVEVEASKPTDN